MTTTGLEGILSAAKPIGMNVFNFFCRFKEYEKIFVKNGSLITRDEAIELQDTKKYGTTLVKIYDEIKERMEWLDISDLYTSSAAIYNCERYDFKNATVEYDSLVILDRDNGDLHYMACDQINAVIRFDAKQKGDVLNYKTGEVETNVEVNKDRVRINMMYKG